MQLSPGICDVKMYDKRDSMPALASYRKFSHIETTVSTSCKLVNMLSSIVNFVDLHTVVPGEIILLMLHLD